MVNKEERTTSWCWLVVLSRFIFNSNSNKVNKGERTTRCCWLVDVSSLISNQPTTRLTRRIGQQAAASSSIQHTHTLLTGTWLATSYVQAPVKAGGVKRRQPRGDSAWFGDAAVRVHRRLGRCSNWVQRVIKVKLTGQRSSRLVYPVARFMIVRLKCDDDDNIL